MKNFPNTEEILKVNSIVSDIKTKIYAEWNMNRYILDGTISCDHTIPGGAASEDVRLDAEQIAKKFPVSSIVKSNRGSLSSYVIEGTKYRIVPKYQEQRARSESSWLNDTTWLWMGNDSPYKYWVSPLPANVNGGLPRNTGYLTYSWDEKRPVNKIVIKFQKDHAFPLSWNILIDTVGNGTWDSIATNALVPADGTLSLYRDTFFGHTRTGDWSQTPVVWTEDLPNHTYVYGIKVEISTVDISYGRPGIIELSPRLEMDLSDFVTEWSVDEEIGNQDFVAPIGTASANTGSLSLSNSSGLFNEFDSDGILHGMLDEEVLVKGYVEYNRDTIPIFTMLSEVWSTTDYEDCEVTLTDMARVLQNTKCKDMVIPNVTAGSALHMLFASLGLEQFDLVETTLKETATLEKFYCKKEQFVWELIQEICRGTQMAAYFDSNGNLKMRTKEATFNSDAVVDYEFTTELKTDRVPDIFSGSKQESSRFNKALVRYYPVNDFSLSGGKSQELWRPDGEWGIGAVQIVSNIEQGDTSFWVDPNAPEQLPRWSGTVLIETFTDEYDYDGKQYYCKNASAGEKKIRVRDSSDYWEAVEKNNGEAPRFTGKIYLKDGTSFSKAFRSKNYNFLNEWDATEFTFGSTDGVRPTRRGTHNPEKGCLSIETKYVGPKRLTISKKNRNWNRFDKVGMKFKMTSTDSRTGLVVWPQGHEGVAGYHFVVDAMTRAEINKSIAAGEQEDTSSPPPPKIYGFIVKTNGERKEMDFDVSKDFKDIPPVRTGVWKYLEVTIYAVTGGYEFEVFVDGQYCKTYKDTTIKLTRNEKAGMTFLGTGTTYVDKFYVVNYPQDAVRSKDDDDAGWVVRRYDLWQDRKSSAGDSQFSKYLSRMERRKKTRVFDSDFSGRFHGIAREKLKENVRFEFPALTAELNNFNNAVDVLLFDPSSFGARMTLVNRSERYQILSGTHRTKVSGAERTQATFVSGKSFRIGEPIEIEEKDQELIDKLGELLIEFDSTWIQNKFYAQNIAEWVVDRFGKTMDIYQLEVFGNPLIEIGDTVRVEWPEKNLGTDQKWCVNKISNSWDNGLSTTLTIRRII